MAMQKMTAGPETQQVPAGHNRQVLLARRPSGEPSAADFTIVDRPAAPLRPHQVRLQTLWLSLDPYMRLRMDARESYAPAVAVGDPMVGAGVARVIESRSASVRAGDLVEARTGWQSHPVADAADVRLLDLPEASARQALGILGMTGFTAYCGLLEIGKPQAGETVVVGAATGAVGSVVGQIARIHGCHVVGIAGGPEKCRIAVQEFGFDACVDHRSPRFAEELAAACAKGVDVYFENVGGAVLDAVLPLLNVGARMPLCGLISQYNGTQAPGTDSARAEFLLRILERRVAVRGFIITDHLQQRAAFLRDMRRWLDEGRFRWRDCVTEGLEQAPQAFIRMLQGGNVGKTLVHVA
jgi:NADPH-dependent curcumin reductase CurA